MRNIFILMAAFITGCTSRQEEQTSVAKTTSYDSASTSNSKYLNLSNEFDLNVNFRRYFFTKTAGNDSCVVELLIHDKQSKAPLDTVSITSRFYPDDAFKNQNNIRSFSTKINTDRQALNNYYGDIIIADLNFDNKDDVIVLNNEGGTGGSFYSYFIQDNNRKFILNSYLTDSMTYFPSQINSKNKTLTTYVPAGPCWLGEHIYKCALPDKYTELSHKIIDICKGKQ
jgi:hypothetical protein